MIRVSRLNGSDLWLNPVLIETIEATPDSIVTMTNGHKYVIRDTPEEVALRIGTFLRDIGLLAVARQKGDEH